MDPITTVDGAVSIRPLADATGYELILDRDGKSQVLVHIAERLAGSNVSFGSVHTVACPAATGLHQQYYVLGQHTGIGGSISVEGLQLVGAQVVAPLYLVAIAAAPAAEESWSLLVNGEVSAGGIGAHFLDLPTTGKRAASGCYSDA
jgi:hypothetical protein